MRPRPAGRLAAAWVVLVAAFGLGFTDVMVGGGRAGGWGAVATVIGAGLAAGVVFTAIYDGPRALLGATRPSRRTSGTRAR